MCFLTETKRDNMLKDGDMVPVECMACGFESSQDIRMLKLRAGRQGLVCGHCHADVQDYAADLEQIIAVDGKPPFSRLRLRPI